jgi:phosphatidylethanolamine-binding protein
MFLLTTAFALSLLDLFANAQPIDNTAMGISAIEADFKISDLVPDLLPSFNPSALMTVTFPGVGPISPGQNLSMQQTAPAPDVTITPANSSVPTTGNFTLMMVDARAVGMNESNGQILHWLANFATLKSDSSSFPSLNVSTDGGLVVTNYVSPQPPTGTGLHRYVILLFSQPPSFSPAGNLSSPNVGIDLYFHLTDYISSGNLGQPIAGMFFEVEGPAS